MMASIVKELRSLRFGIFLNAMDASDHQTGFEKLFVGSDAREGSFFSIDMTQGNHKPPPKHLLRS
jgi:hypothetical protein